MAEDNTLNKWILSPLFLAASLCVTGIGGCSLVADDTCETPTEVQAQERECQELRQQIEANSERLQTRSALEELYQKHCVELRYYRDNFDDSSRCNQEETKAALKEAEKQ